MVYLPGTSIVTSIGKNRYTGVYGNSFSCAMCSGLISLIIEEEGKNYNPLDIMRYIEKKGIAKDIDFINILTELKKKR